MGTGQSGGWGVKWNTEYLSRLRNYTYMCIYTELYIITYKYFLNILIMYYIIYKYIITYNLDI